MAKYLVIVESPAKVKTIKKFLGANYEVMASNGHVRDLPKSKLGIDVEHDYEPQYITIRGKGDLLAALRKAARKADRVYLATDPDREGEAISWHLSIALNVDPAKLYRITFNEITKQAVKASLKNARAIDMDLVNAQQVRRILDRMVGYKISPILWAKVKRGLSAGRVQSAALRLIADREEEINAFIPEEYWSVEAELAREGEKGSFKAHLTQQAGSRVELHTREAVDRIEAKLQGASFSVADVKNTLRQKKAPLPFTTSTLQQEAAKQLNFATQKTMRIAQQLYEGVEVKGAGTVGLISYLRTDSTRVSEEADISARAYIREQYGEDYVAEAYAQENKGKKIQDAHEAIRPTDIARTPVKVKESLTRDQFRLYQLIWKRFAASRMTPARYEVKSVQIAAADLMFSAAVSHITFEGYQAVYTEAEDEKAAKSRLVDALEPGMPLKIIGLDPQQHFTQAAPHYTEASLVKTMEEIGIGRPSTYAPTITTIIARRYVAKENKNLYLTELGDVVNQMMKEAFPSIVDVHFTAAMEDLLDNVDEGTIEWKTIVRNFYPDLASAVEAAEKDLSKVEIEDEQTEELCENCGRHMVIKYGPHGKFLACPGFPECKNTKPYLEKIGVGCPLCRGEVILRKTKKGRKYYGCENNPECEFMSWSRPSKKACPKCGGYMLEKGNKLVCHDTACGYVETRKES